MTDLALFEVEDPNVLSCAECPAQLAPRSRHDRLEHHADGSHTVHGLFVTGEPYAAHTPWITPKHHYRESGDSR